MIRGSELIGRTVVDMEAATRMGKIKEVILQRDGERVAGFVVASGETIVGSGGTRRVLPASALHAIGPDAITAHAVKEKIPEAEFDELPRMSDVIGHKMVTQSGRLLGSIDDVLINGADGKIIGFAVGESLRNRLENMFHPESSRVRGYVRADADLQVGNDLVVVPDEALIEGEPATSESETKRPSARSEEIDAAAWEDSAHASETPSRSIWNRRGDHAKTPESTETSLTPVDQPGEGQASPTRRIVPIQKGPVITEGTQPGTS